MNFKPTVDKSKLLEVLRKNLAEHEQIVREAKEGYRDKVREALSVRLKAIEEGGPINLSFDLKPPRDHSADYGTAIEMLEWTQDETISLEPHDFRQLVLNQWSWQRDFLTTNSLYSPAASGCLAGLGI